MGSNLYRIKVMPYRGQIIYMPQQKIGWFCWSDMYVTNCVGYYSDFDIDIMCSWESCNRYLDKLVAQHKLQLMTANKEKEFAKANPIKYVARRHSDE